MKARVWLGLGLLLAPTMIRAVEVVRFEVVAIRRLTQPPLITQRIKLYSDVTEDTFRTLFEITSPQSLTLSFFTPLNSATTKWVRDEHHIALRMIIPRGTTLVVAQYNGTSRRNLPLNLKVNLPLRLLDVFTDTTLALRGYRSVGEVVQDGDRYLHYRVPVARGQTLELRFGPPLPTFWILLGAGGLLAILGIGVGLWFRRRRTSLETVPEPEEETDVVPPEVEEEVPETIVPEHTEVREPLASGPSPSTDPFAALGVIESSEPVEPPAAEAEPPGEDTYTTPPEEPETSTVESPSPTPSELPEQEALPPRMTPQTVEAPDAEDEENRYSIEASILGEEEEPPSFEDTLQEALKTEERTTDETLLLPEAEEKEEDARASLEEALIPEEHRLPVEDPFQKLMEPSPEETSGTETPETHRPRETDATPETLIPETGEETPPVPSREAPVETESEPHPTFPEREETTEPWTDKQSPKPGPEPAERPEPAPPVPVEEPAEFPTLPELDEVPEPSLPSTPHAPSTETPVVPPMPPERSTPKKPSPRTEPGELPAKPEPVSPTPEQTQPRKRTPSPPPAQPRKPAPPPRPEPQTARPAVPEKPSETGTGKGEKVSGPSRRVPDDPEERIRQWLLKKKQQKKRKG